MHTPRRQNPDGAVPGGIHARDLNISSDRHILRRRVVRNQETPDNLFAIVKGCPWENHDRGEVGGNAILASTQVVAADRGERPARRISYPGIHRRSEQVAGDGKYNRDIVLGR